jgi:signal recognition particle receptor subunit beta
MFKLILSSIWLFILTNVLASALAFVLALNGGDETGALGCIVLVETLGIFLIVRRFRKIRRKEKYGDELEAAQARIQSTIILIGLPNSGKTVFWNVALNKLQSQLNETKNTRLRLGMETNNYNSSLLATLTDEKNPRWPSQEQETIAYDFDITGKPKIYIKDFPGKDFTEFNNRLKNNLKESGIIFLIIDSAQLYGKKNNTNLRDTLDKFMSYLQSIDEKLKNTKIGIVFTKNDIYNSEHIVIVPEEELKKRCQNFYSILTAGNFLHKYKFFYVSAVGTRINDDGDIVPEWNDNDSTLDPFLWAFELKITK